MKIIKDIFHFIGFLFSSIFYFICFIFRRISIIVLILVLLLTGKSVVNTIRYEIYDETGVMLNGNLCISHMCETSGYDEKYYNSDNNVLQEVKRFTEWKGVKLGIGNWTGDAVGIVYKPINSGTSDIYVEISKYPGVVTKDFERYHVEVDKDLNITYSVETIDKERFEQNQK